MPAILSAFLEAHSDAASAPEVLERVGCRSFEEVCFAQRHFQDDAVNARRSQLMHDRGVGGCFDLEALEKDQGLVRSRAVEQDPGGTVVDDDNIVIFQVLRGRLAGFVVFQRVKQVNRKDDHGYRECRQKHAANDSPDLIHNPKPSENY